MVSREDNAGPSRAAAQPSWNRPVLSAREHQLPWWLHPVCELWWQGGALPNHLQKWQAHYWRGRLFWEPDAAGWGETKRNWGLFSKYSGALLVLTLVLYSALVYCMYGVLSCFRVPVSLCYLIDHIQFLEQIMNRKCQRGRVNSMLRFRALTSKTHQTFHCKTTPLCVCNISDQQQMTNPPAQNRSVSSVQLIVFKAKCYRSFPLCSTIWPYCPLLVIVQHCTHWIIAFLGKLYLDWSSISVVCDYCIFFVL